MVRPALALALAVTLAGAVLGCRAAEPERQREAPKAAAPNAASATGERVTPTSPSTKPEGVDERGVIDGGLAGIPKGLPSSSASTLQANHNPKGSEPERRPDLPSPQVETR